MTYALGTGSLARLHNVHPALARVVLRAIEITPQDFTVLEGVRTLAAQRVNVAKGVSKTMDSKHLLQPDGFGHAVDLVPWLNGTPRWEWPLIYPVAHAMWTAAQAFNTPLRWGGVWDRPFLSLNPSDLAGEVRAYCVRHVGPNDFLDGPHYELA